ncbi:MAG: InlB B-repeat-containing protein, partial [Clostridiales bacterium]|nr:InlB B-repeat-containing protein [Clostridiales bacterium]
NSYLFKPSGTTNMLIEPVKDEYVLAGWYTDKEEIKDSSGEVTGYSFKAEDRWDFDEDRVQEDMTLYARWVPQARVDYVDAITGEVMFSKNITKDSAIQPLSAAVENLIAKEGHSFEGYYEDEALTTPYDFSGYEHQDLIIDNSYIYAMLYDEFPNYIKKVKYEGPSEEDLESELDTSDLYINKLGYEIVEDEAARKKIRKRKDEIYDEYINSYIENTANRVVYLKYSEGSYAQISNVDQLKSGGKVWFSGVDKAGNPIDGYNILNDLDFQGVSVAMADTFKGDIIGNGHSIKNINFTINSKRVDRDKKKEVGIFNELDGAYIENLTFENINILVNANPGIAVTIGPLALKAKNTKLKNIKFKDISIDTGRSDDGGAVYNVGDVFAQEQGSKLENVSGENITIKASESANIHAILE